MRIQFSFLKYDTMVQSIFFGINTLMLLGSFFAPYLLFWVAILQIPIGIYQLGVSNFTHLFVFKSFSAEITKFRRIYFYSSIIFLILFVLTAIVSNNSYGNGNFLELLLILEITLCTQIFAYSYFYLTIKDYKSRKDYYTNRPTIFAY